MAKPQRTLIAAAQGALTDWRSPTYARTVGEWVGSVARGGQQALAKRGEHRGEPLVLFLNVREGNSLAALVAARFSPIATGSEEISGGP
ncbi:hypothetical protein [Mycobacterium sp.]|uniref:hypothetical protein n=1 Tax=Mycobacterium sp. TaxID=1785 RepID=UPI002C2C56B5|nr:hypothetical protein [Mycobacterium sp.]HKP41459.1 hypothetical protein [Mycobacterium sp.]